MQYIVRLFPEISIKSRPVRNKLTRLTARNLENAGLRHGVRFRTESQWDKIVVTCDDAEAAKAETELRQVPGIHSYSPVTRFAFRDLDDLYTKLGPVCGPKLKDRTFCVRVRRHGRHPFSSMDAERFIGGRLHDDYPSAGVNLTTPEVKLEISIENDSAFLQDSRCPGMGGFPVGSQGEVFCLISGGFDSAVAAYLALRRGLRVSFLFFNMGGTAHELGVKQESYYLWDRFASSHRVRFVTVPFEEVVEQILGRTHHGVRGVLLKRMMVRVGSLVAERYKADGLVTGECLAQVSSQTLINLNHIDRAATLSIIRPLITWEKQEIIDFAGRIGTASFAESMPEYCGVISDHPNVCPSRDFIESEEAKLDVSLADHVMDKIRVCDVRDIPQQLDRMMTEVETVSEPASGDVILDVRAPDEAAAHPLEAPDHEVVQMPFFRVARDFKNLDPLYTYALYCEQGVMSTMLAKQLKDMGHHNVRVWRPVSKQV